MRAGSQCPSRHRPTQQLNTQIFTAIWFLSARPSWARLSPPGPRNVGICSCLNHASANPLACSNKDGDGEKTELGFAAFSVLLGCCGYFENNQKTTNHKKPTFLKEGLLLLPLSFCSCSVWKVLLQLTLVTGKRASSSQQNKGAVSSFFFYSRILRKAFFAARLLGEGGSEVSGETLGNDLGLRNDKDRDAAGVQLRGFGGTRTGGQSRRSGEQMLCLLRRGPGI